MKLPKSSYNWITIVGAFISIFSLLLIIALFIVASIFDSANSYLGLFIYIAFPAFFVLGLLIIPIGMIRKSRKLAKQEDGGKEWPKLDLADVRHRNAFLLFMTSTLVILFLTSIGSYEAFHYTESVEFCGTLCHDVMQPEYVAYQHSAHANVACVECHVGSGANWYVKSKVSGLYQVYSVIFGKYPRPIATPLHDLRPAHETCEHCHWPQKFYANKLRVQKSFLADSLNTEWDITLKMKIGPSYSALAHTEGIHWHINPDVEIEYISSDPTREMIPWVRLRNKKTGEETIFQDADYALEDSIINTAERRRMDCIDCHNRPAHTYKSAPDYIDNAIIAGAIDKEIPMIKRAAMQALVDPFTNKDTAYISIESSINEYYATELPDFYEKSKTRITDAIEAIKTAFSQNEFPHMAVRYDAYPDHIGHLETEGCFRCHSDRHTSASGKTISKDCNICHTIVSQGTVDSLQSVPINEALEFKHPVDIGTDWRDYNCSECHKYLY